MLPLVNLGIGLAAHRRIDGVESNVRVLDHRVDEGELSAVSLRRDIEKLYLVVEALWAIVRQATDLKDDELRNLIREIDAKDGKCDGRNANNTAIVQCAKCGKTILKGQTTCAYCGEPIPDDGNFRHAGR